ncbi:MAG: SCO family protein [Planctomycetes bacterium]|nr:SCO family protein [Planctomycetota bacterium]
MSRLSTLLERTFAGWRFGAWAIGLVVAYELWLLLMLVVPAGDGPFAAFAAEFRAWCFGADVATGSSNQVQAFAMLTSPLLILAVVHVVWGDQLRLAWRHARGRLFGHGGAAVGLAAATALALLWSAEVPANGPLPFPAAAIRTAVPAPEVRLVAHDGSPFDLAAERGRVVLMTAVYSQCGYTCPGLLADLHATLSALTPAERNELRVVIPTLDPVRDTLPILAEVAKGRNFAAPGVRMLTGEPPAVESALDRLGFERRRDPQTGVIDHANLFVLIDRRGRVAYRLAPSDTQKHWLLAAVRALLAEDAGA